MKKFTTLCLIAPSLTGAQLYATAAAAGAAHPFNTTVDVQAVIAGFIEDPSETMNLNTTRRAAALENAAIDYATALKDGKHVPDNTMKVVRTARHDIKDSNNVSEREQIAGTIINNIRDLDEKTLIHLPNKIPPFLSASVTDMTPFIYDSIDGMRLNPHIAEHMKHSVGHYYEIESNPWTENTVDPIQNKLNAMAKEYRLLDDAITEDTNLKGVNYIVIPDVGATDEAITSRTAELDALFAAHPHLTLVIAFADDVTEVGEEFCCGRLSTLSTHVKKLSFTGKKLKKVGMFFFNHARSITSLDFRGLSALHTVGWNFFTGVKSLASVDFRGLSALHTVGKGFFPDAESLTSVDFRGLGALHTVGGSFFWGTEALTSVDFRGLGALHTVGGSFFAGTEALTSVDFRGLSALHTVGMFFFYKARALTSVDFRGLSALERIGIDFFSKAPALTSILVCNDAQAAFICSQYKGDARIIVEAEHAVRATPDPETK